MIKKIKKFSDAFLTFLGGIVVAAMLVFYIFIENPVTYFLYAFIIAAAFNFRNLRFIRADFRNAIRDFSVSLGIVYLVVIILMSLSPFLKIQEFKISHWNWKAVDAGKTKASASWDRGYKRKGNSYADVYYTYPSGKTLYKKTEPEALKRYYPFWNSQAPDELVTEFSRYVSEKIRQKDFAVFYSPENPGKSKLFLSTDLFYFKGSLFYDFITSFVTMIIGIMGLITAIILFSNRNTLG